MEHHCLVDAVHELRRELAPRRLDADLADLLLEIRVHFSGIAQSLCFRSGKSHIGPQQGSHFVRAQVAGHEDHGAGEIYTAVVAQCQRGLIQNAKQQVPQGIAGFLDFIEKHKAQLHLVGVVLIQYLLAEKWMRFAMPEISGRRSDQLGDFMAVLELGAVDLDHRSRVSGKGLRRRFHQSRFSGAGWPQEEKVTNWPAGADHARQIGLVDVDDLFDRLILTYNFAAKARFQVSRVVTRQRRV